MPAVIINPRTKNNKRRFDLLIFLINPLINGVYYTSMSDMSGQLEAGPLNGFVEKSLLLFSKPLTIQWPHLFPKKLSSGQLYLWLRFQDVHLQYPSYMVGQELQY